VFVQQSGWRYAHGFLSVLYAVVGAQMNILPNPENPFEVDFASFDKMDPMERTLQAVQPHKHQSL
jgi:hypothetical protein